MRFLKIRIPNAFAAIVLMCAFIITVVWAVTWQRTVFEQQEEIEQAVQASENLALAFEEHTQKTLALVDQTLRFLAVEHLHHGAQMDTPFFDKLVALDPATYVFIGVIDAQGTIKYGTGTRETVSVADRDYFIHHRQSADDRLRVSGPVRGRVSGRVSIQLSRRITNADGGFAGVAVAGIDPAYFSRFYDRINLGASGLAELVGLNGINLLRHTGDTSSGLDMRGSTLIKRAAREDSGSYLALGRYDGIPRYISFRVMREQGIVVAVGMSKAYVLAEVHARRWWYLLGSSLATLFVLVFGTGIIVAMRRQRRAMQASLAGEALYRATFDQAAVGISHNALDGRFLRANARYCALVGYSEDELRSRKFTDILHPDDVPGPEQMQHLMAHGCLEIENRHVCKDGSMKWASVAVSIVRDANGKPDYMVAMVQDVTERNEAQARLLRQSHYDELTGLPNRLLLLDRLTQTLNQARRKAQTAAVLFVNLDRFKAVNDTFGRGNGDLLLREAAQRLAGALRAQDTVARIGGDEFVVALPEIRNADDAARVARKIIDAMAAPFRVGDAEIFVTASVGIAVFPGDGPDGETLLRNADAAMARAKEIGRNNFQFYTATMNEHSPQKLLLEADLRRALERNEFRLHYQPKVSLQTGRVTGLEALLRWQRTDGKLVPPGDFIPLLEESGLIGAVGNWVINTACAQIRDWQRGGLVPLPVAVNVATRQFLQNDLYAEVDGALRKSGIEARLLEVEITESDAMQDQERVVPVLDALRGRGVTIAIDDFGTGYSSLSYLSKLPVQTLKIDRSFIIRLASDPNATTLVSTMITLAHALKLKVVAEGVEHEDQSSMLRLLHCDEMQGYLFSRPLPAAECTRYLDTADVAPAPAEAVA